MSTGIVFDPDDAKAIALLKQWQHEYPHLRRVDINYTGECESHPWEVVVTQLAKTITNRNGSIGHTLLQATRDALGMEHD